MVKENIDEVIKRIDDTIEVVKNKQSKLFFFVVDSKDMPNSSMAYIYEMALTLKNKGYDVTMLYQLEGEYTETERLKKEKKGQYIDYEKVFVGVEKWLGKEYMELEHINIAREHVGLSPADILFIPEALSGMMFETYRHKAPCKRVVILQDFNRVTDFIQPGVEWKHYGISDVLARTEKQKELIKDVFPYTNVKVLNPMISPVFRKTNRPKNLVVNIISKDQRVFNHIVKTFYWKFPMYNWVTFADLRFYPREKFAEALQNNAITVWVDNETPFGFGALEAMKCGSIVIGQIPAIIPEWMENDGELLSSGVWFYDINNVPEILSEVVGSWMQDGVPEEIYIEMDKATEKYSPASFEENVEKTINEYCEEHINSLESVKKSILNSNNKAENKEEA